MVSPSAPLKYGSGIEANSKKMGTKVLIKKLTPVYTISHPTTPEKNSPLTQYHKI
jgi:hypothetical protein